MGASHQARAREALQLVALDPARAADLAAATAAAALADRDRTAAAIAERALGLTRLHLHEPGTAVGHLRRSIGHARAVGSVELAAEARMTLAYAHNERGHTGRAMSAIDRALRELTGVARARALAQRAAILHQQGRLDEAVEDYRGALPVLRQAEDVLWVQRTLTNLGLLHALRHEYDKAIARLEECGELCEGQGLKMFAALVQENLGYVHSRRGDVPRALRHLAAAERQFRLSGAPVDSVLVDRAELLLSVCLAGEARTDAARAVAEMAGRNQWLRLPEARLLLARAALLDGDPAAALAEARQAARELGRQRRHRWVALARYTALTALVADEGLGRVSPGQLARAGAALRLAGWPDAALDANVAAGRLALGRGRNGEAERHLSAAARHRHRGPATRRARAWYAEALRRYARHDPRGARTATGAGLRVLDEHRDTLGATDLRAQAAGLRADMVTLALRTVLGTGTAWQVLCWAERGRARHLAGRPAAPAKDPELAGYLAELRGTAMEVSKEREAGRPVGALTQRQLALEQTIRDYYRHQPAAPGAGPVNCPDRGELCASLGDAALVEFVQLDGVLHAVTAVAGRLRLTGLGPIADVEQLVSRIPFALRLLSRANGTTEGRGASLAMLRHTAQRLDQFVRPALAGVGDRPLVLVPTGALQSVPWSMLPSQAGREITVAPSAGLWCAARRRAWEPGGPMLVAAGPGLPGARREAEAVAAIHGVRPMVGAAATVGAAMRGLNRASLAHLATHGHLRADSPMFSALELTDGPLTVYDLELLDRGPQTVVLAACDSGRAVVCAGDELLGLGATFLAKDTRNLVASVMPVPDAETEPMMVAFHRHLAAGRPVAAALAAAQEATAREYPAALGFICIGSGFDPAVLPAAAATTS